MSDECPVCEEEYSDFASEKHVFSDYGARGLENIRVCPAKQGAFVHLWERKITITFKLHEKWNTIEVYERNEVREHE